MHSAPSVSYPVGRSRFAAVCLIGAWALGAATAGAWWVQAQTPGWRLWAGSLSLLVAGGAATAHWWRSPGGQLAWDGAGWNWSVVAAQGGTVEVSLDLQRWLLLRWSAGGARQWLWLERASCPALWDDLRRAVYSRARPHALRDAEPPAAKT